MHIIGQASVAMALIGELIKNLNPSLYKNHQMTSLKELRVKTAESGVLTSRISSSLMRRVISFLAFCIAISLVASMAKYSFLSPSLGSLLGGK